MSTEAETGLRPPAAVPVERYTLNGPTMGTRWSAVFYAPTGRQWLDLAGALQSAVDLVDRQMSTWKPESDLMRLNAAPVGKPVPVPSELMTVLAAAFDIGRRSGGAFDVGVGAAVRAWGFGPAGAPPDRPAPGAPSDTMQVAAHDAVAIDLERGTATLQAPVAIDLSGIAKGYGVDRLAETMDVAGVASYLVSIDGELRARGQKPGRESWTVAVEKPLRGRRDVVAVLGLEDAAIATSGDYRHYIEQDGRFWSHTIDPRTGRPVDNDVASVSVMAPTCMVADAWATALMVLGREEGGRLAHAVGIEALFMTRDGPA